MELPEHMALADLKKAIKEFKTKDTPKLSSKKSVLSEYAVRVGILAGNKSRLGQPPVEAQAAPLQPRSEKKSEALPEVLKAKSKKSELKEAMPDVLKAPAPKAAKKSEAKKSEAKSEAPKKKGSPFSAYMAAHKGKGYSMKDLASMYKDQKQ
jgi:hypothetical protein